MRSSCSQSGECFHNVTVTGGKPSAPRDRSRMKRELRDVLLQNGRSRSGRWARRKLYRRNLGRDIKPN